jgi:hypothetical protein
LSENARGNVEAGIERVITYQGILRDTDGNTVVDGDYQIVFRLYDRASGGAPVWTGPPQTVATAEGLFTVELSPIPLTFDTTYYLSLQIESDLEMADRQRLTMTTYSASADTAAFSGQAGLATRAGC